MFDFCQESGYTELLPGIRQKTRVFGANTLMAEFLLNQGCALPVHTHPYEQTGYLIKGRLRLWIGEQEWEVHPGDAWCIPMNVEHGAQVLEESVAVEVFSPAREDYLPKSDD